MSWFLRVLLACAITFVVALPTVAAAEAPLTVALPSVGVEAPIEQLGVVDGQLGVPADPHAVGIYELPGNTVLVGHVDWDGRPGPFYALRTLHEGDPIELSDGRQYHVAWISSVGASHDSAAQIFADANGGLTLITCGGPYSLSRHDYLQRLIVRADPD